MSRYWDAEMPYPTHSPAETPLRGLPNTMLDARYGIAPSTDGGVDELPYMYQVTAAGTGYTQPLVRATASSLFDSSQALVSATPRQYRLNAAVPLDPHLQGDNYVPPYASSFRSFDSQKAPISSLAARSAIPYGPPNVPQSAHGPHRQQTPASAVNDDQNAPIDAAPFALARFPLSNADHFQKRQALMSIINSEWWLRNNIEPEERLLLQFMIYDKHEQRFKCCFWEEGNPCQCSCKGKDHAKGHVRFHLQHFPFACEPPCPRNGANCEKRYPTPGPLYKHRIAKVECPECGMSMLQGNLQRHQEGPCRGTSRTLNSTNSP